MYSGLDNNNPEILDYGIFNFDTHNWADLYVNFRKCLSAIIARKLPPFKQLETYLIPPIESVIPVRVRYPEDDRDNKIEQLNWEIGKFLVHSEKGYLAEHYGSKQTIANSMQEDSGLAIRNEHTTHFNQIMKDNSLFLAGLIFSQTLVRDFFKNPDFTRRPVLLYKDTDAYSMFTSKPGGYPESNRFAYHTRAGENCDELALIRIIDNLTVDRMTLNQVESKRIFVFDKNLSDDETEFIKKALPIEMRVISDDFKPAGFKDDFVDYFLLCRAHKKIGELCFTV